MSKRNVSFIKPPEPAFIRRLKERVGYQEGPTVDTKKEDLPVSNESDDERDEESPTIVVLEKGDLTSEEYYKEIKQQEDTKKADLSEKIVFRKPKRTNENPLNVTTKKGRTEITDTSTAKKDKSSVKNTKLLSFDEDEDDDEKD